MSDHFTTLQSKGLNLVLTHTKWRIDFAVWKYSKSSRLEVLLGMDVLKMCSKFVLEITCLRGRFGGKFTEFTFLKFWNLSSETRKISKFQKMNEVNFPKISWIILWFLVNHTWQALNAIQEHTRVRITQKTINQYWLI